MPEIVTITVDMASGDADVDLEGFNGKGCAAIQEAFARAMAATPVPPVLKTPK